MELLLPWDETLAIAVPIVVYWVYSGVYMMLGSIDKYRLHSREDEETKNLVPKWEVAKEVLRQQLVQAAVAFLVLKIRNNTNATATNKQTPIIMIGLQFFIGMFIMDTWQYFWHRYMHLNKFFYRHIHSWHHRLYAPYAFGSQYNHPLEGLLFNTLGGALAFMISGMSPRTSIFFFSFSIMKGIDHHSGLWIPWNVLDWVFPNNAAFHDVHHQLYGSRYNFSQPFFISWDKIMGTYMPYEIRRRDDGGLETRLAKD